MPDSDPRSRIRRFNLNRLRILHEASDDPGFRNLRGNDDFRMLLTFLERFDELGWLPPITEEKRRLLAAHDVIIHRPGERICFYEYCSKGGRGERNPWLSIFFHVSSRDGRVRICAIEETAVYERRRVLTLERVRRRVEMLLRSVGA